jgi:hypothetical protein
MPASPGANRIYQVTSDPCSLSIPISVTAGPEIHVVRLFGWPYIQIGATPFCYPGSFAVFPELVFVGKETALKVACCIGIPIGPLIIIHDHLHTFRYVQSTLLAEPEMNRVFVCMNILLKTHASVEKGARIEQGRN